MRQSPNTIKRIKDLYFDNRLPLLLRGRCFGLSEIRIIHLCTEVHYNEGRTAISRAVCERLEWRQPNGWLKDRACRDVLRYMSGIGIIELPPSKTGARLTKPHLATESSGHSDVRIDTSISDFPASIELVFAKGNKHENTWNQLVDKYHYLGHRVTVGRSLKYLITSELGLLGAICFSSASWHLKTRDTLLRDLGYSPDELREIVINNSRFLVLPHVNVANLASKLLSLATRRVAADWSWYYSIEPQYVETFVEQSRFDGACYKAANWTYIGTTKGYAKSGSSHRNSQEPKAIFLYGLNKRTRKLLLTVSAD